MNPQTWLVDGLIAGASASTLAAVLRAILPRARSAGARHDAHLIVILVALVAFAAGAWLPRIELAWLPSRAAAQERIAAVLGESTRLAVWWILWATLAGVLLARRVAAEWTLLRFARRAQPLDSRLWNAVLAEAAEGMGIAPSVRIVTHSAVVGGATFGVLRPVVVMAEQARSGTSERWRTVLLHELAHVQRRDHLAGVTADLACALFWFLPWIAYSARRMRVERELACDDRVISLGARPSGYAALLLDLMRREQRGWAARGPRSVLEWNALATSTDARNGSHFEQRLQALLRARTPSDDPEIERAPRLGAAAAGALIFASLQLVPRLAAESDVPAKTVQAEAALQSLVSPRSSDAPIVDASETGPPVAARAPAPIADSSEGASAVPAPRRTPTRIATLADLPDALREPVRRAIADALCDLDDAATLRMLPVSLSVIRRTIVIEPPAR